MRRPKMPRVVRAVRRRAILEYKAEHPEATLMHIADCFGLGFQRVGQILREASHEAKEKAQ